MRSVYLYIEEYDQLIVDTFLNANDQFISYEVKGNLVIFKEDVVDDFDYSTIKDLMEVDFNRKITIIIGGDSKLVNKHIKALPQDIYYMDDFIVYLIGANKGKELKAWLNKFDNELLHTIKKFIDNDLSVTQSAKDLYVHRNTLNYRLDKFNKLSGLNVRTFKGSLAVYLILNFVQTAN